MYTCLHADMPTYIHTYIYTCIHACMHTYIHIYLYTYVYILEHIYIHTYRDVNKRFAFCESNSTKLRINFVFDSQKFFPKCESIFSQFYFPTDNLNKY